MSGTAMPVGDPDAAPVQGTPAPSPPSPSYADGAQPIYVGAGGPDPAPQQPGLLQRAGAALKSADSSLKDFSSQVYTSAAGLGEDALGAASLAARKLTADPNIVGWIEQQKQNVQQSVNQTVQGMSPAAQRALHSSLFGSGQDGDYTPGQVGWGNYIASSAADLVPQMAMAILPGGIVSKLASSAVSRVAATGTVARVAGEAAHVGTTMGLFGSTSAGHGYNEMVNDVDNASTQTMLQSPLYRQFVDQGMTDRDARKALVGKLATTYAGIDFATGAVAGAGADRLASNAILSKGAGVIKRLATNAAAGGAVFGTTGGIQDVASQSAQEQEGIRTEFDPAETAKAVAGGVLQGAAMGAPGGLHGEPAEPTTVGEKAAAGAAEPKPGVQFNDRSAEIADNEEDENEHVDPAHAAAVNSAVEAPAAVDPVVAQPHPSAAEPAAAVPPAPEPASAAPAPPPTPPNGEPTAQATPVPATTPEPHGDVTAQVGAMMDPRSTRDAVFVAKGTPMPTVPDGVKVVRRAEGALLTTNPDKAKAFRTGAVDDAKMAQVLGFPEAKPDAVASGNPQVVQAVDGQGNVQTEMLASPNGVPAARQAAQAQAPDASVRVVSPADAQARRTLYHGGQPYDGDGPRFLTPDRMQAEGYARKSPGGVLHSIDVPRDDPELTDATFADDQPPAAFNASPAMLTRYGLKPVDAPAPAALSPAAQARAARKAAMAPPGERVRGTVTTVGDDGGRPSGGDAEPAARAPTYDAAKRITSTVSRLPQSIEVRSGTDVRKIVNSAMRDVIRQINTTDGSQDAVHEAIGNWADTLPKGKVPGTNTAYRDVASNISRLMTDRDLGAKQQFRAESGVEARTQGPTVGGERAPTRAEDEGVASERKSMSDRSRVGKDLLDGVLNGEMSPAEADRAYGKPDKVGRPREYPEFAHYVEDQLHEATTRRDAADTEAVTQAGREGTKAANRELELTSTDRIDRLQSVLDELGGKPADADSLRDTRNARRMAADKIRRERLSPAILDAVRAATRRRRTDLMKAIEAPDLNRSVRRLMLDTHMNGTRHTIGDYLDEIARDPSIATRAPQASWMASTLHKLVNPDLPVRTVSEFADDDSEWGAVARETAEDHAGFYSHYWPSDRPEGEDGAIVLNHEMHGSPVEVMLHETAHALTSRYLDSLGVTNDTRGEVEEGDSNDVRALKAIWRETQRMGKAVKNDISPQMRNDLDYALSNLHELHTMALTHPGLMQLMAEHKPSAIFKHEMSQFGYRPGTVRSLWRAFTGAVRRMFGMSYNDDPDKASFLDHALEPLQKVAEDASIWNEKNPNVNALGMYGTDFADGTPLLTHDTMNDAMPKVFGRKDTGPLERMYRASDTRRHLEDLDRVALSAAPLDQIVKWNGGLFEARDGGGNGLKDFRDAQSRVAHAQKDARDRYAPVIKKLMTRWSGIGKARQDGLARLMNDATLNEAYLDTADREAANKHLTKTPDGKKTLDDLGARYDALHPDDQQLYNDVRAHYGRMYDEERDAQFHGLMKVALPEATDAQRDAVFQVAKSKRALEKFMKDPDNSDVAQSFGDTWQDYNRLVKGVASIMRRGFVRGDYFPLRRYGRFVVRYGDQGSEGYGVERFEKLSEAEDRAAELRQQDHGNVQALDARTVKMRDMLPGSLADELATEAQRRGAGSDEVDHLRDTVNSVILQHNARSTSARMAMRRQGVAGASLDYARNMASDYLSFTSRIGYLQHGSERDAALGAMRRQRDWLGRNENGRNQRRASAVIGEMEQRLPVGDDNSGFWTGLAKNMSSLGFVHSLMSPSTMVTHTMEAHMNSVPLLTSRHGPRALLALGKAIRDVAPSMGSAGFRNTFKAGLARLEASDWNLSTVVRDDMIRRGADRDRTTDLVGAMNEAGLIDHTAEREMLRIADAKRDITAGYWDRFVDLTAAGQHAVDVANRMAIAKAAYDLEYARGGDHDVAKSYALNTLRDAMPNYNFGNKPRIATEGGPIKSPLAGPVFQFKIYGLHMYSMMGNLLHASLRGATNEQKREGRIALAGVLATHAMMAGALTLIEDPLRMFGGLYDLFTGASEPQSYDRYVRAWATRTFGKTWGEVFSRGLPHLAGIDVHKRIGLDNLLELPDMEALNWPAFFQAVGTAGMGASGEDATEMAKGASQLLHGDVWGGIKALVPRVARDPMAAYELATQGVQSRGQTVLSPEQIGPAEIAERAVGFQPQAVTEFREGREAVREVKTEAKDERSQLIAEFAGAPHGPARATAIREVQLYNRAHPGAMITHSSLMRAVQERRRNAQTSRRNPEAFGLQMPRHGAKELSEAGSFANVN